MAANECEKLLLPRFRSVCTKTETCKTNCDNIILIHGTSDQRGQITTFVGDTSTIMAQVGEQAKLSIHPYSYQRSVHQRFGG